VRLKFAPSFERLETPEVPTVNVLYTGTGRARSGTPDRTPGHIPLVQNVGDNDFKVTGGGRHLGTTPFRGPILTARRPLLALALVSALVGCVSSPPNGPLAEYRPGAPPVTRTIPCEANYALVARDGSGAGGPFGEHHLRTGERVGFRPGPDGSVTAVGPGYTLVLPSGDYAWEVVPGSVPPARERWLRETREHALMAAKVAGVGMLVATAAVGVAAVVAVVVVAHAHWPGVY
jgi:hypothetical protein